jgi:beta-1,4-mannooligosaccharide/beta-1,4-mannosyl-N-acetylglucosamine phosphorylase
MARVEDRRGHSHLTAARSRDGVTGWVVDQKPTLMADPENYPEELWGIEDPRIVYLAELEKYSICYTAYSSSGPLVSLALTEDFRTFERRGVVLPPEDKDASLFPHRFDGRWAMIHRPVPAAWEAGAHIWISFSPDLIHWGRSQVLLEARRGAWWDANRIGLSPPPLETPEGWIIMYHGVRRTPSGSIYRLGLALLDLENPTKVIRRGPIWVFAPEEEYERVGDVADVVFPCGLVYKEATDEVYMYYGAADTAIALAIASRRHLVDWLLTEGEPWH